MSIPRLTTPQMDAQTDLLKRIVPRREKALTMPQLGRALGLQQTALFKLRRKYKSLPVRHVGKQLVIQREALIRWLYEVPEGIAWRVWHEEHDRWHVSMLETREEDG